MISIYKDSIKQTVSIVKNGEVIATMTMGEWSRLIAHPVVSFP